MVSINRWSAFGLVVVAVVVLGDHASLQRSTSDEAGTIIIHHIERPIGEERYRVVRDSDGRSTLVSELAYVDRGDRVELSASLHLSQDLSPIHFEAKGKTYRFVNIDAVVDVHDGTFLMLWNEGNWSSVTRRCTRAHHSKPFAL
jgi:hypothetical protein